LDGTLTFSQSGTGPIAVNGGLSGLAPSTPYVAVPYKDGICLPTPGVTAFPSGPSSEREWPGPGPQCHCESCRDHSDIFTTRDQPVPRRL
jgi:hypothetical protein